MKDDKRHFEQKVLKLIRKGITPFSAYAQIELRHKRRHGIRMYHSFAHYTKDTRIRIDLTL